MSLAEAVMVTCDFNGCNHAPLYAPKLHVPFEGISLSSSDPVAGFIGLRLCERHANAADPKDFTNLQSEFERLAGPTGGLKFDWDRAFFTKIRIDSDEYKRMEGTPGDA